MSGIVQGGRIIRSGDNAAIAGIRPSGFSAQGKVIWKSLQNLWEFLSISSVLPMAYNLVTSPVDTTDADLFIFFHTRGTTADFTIGDSANNTWLEGISQSNGPYTSTLYYCIHPQTSQLHTFQVTGSFYSTLMVAAFKAPPLLSHDQQSSIAVSSTSIQLPAITPMPSSLVITSLAAGLNQWITLGSLDESFVVMGQIAQTGWSAFQVLAYAIVNDAVPLTPVWTISPSDAMLATMLSFKPS